MKTPLEIEIILEKIADLNPDAIIVDNFNEALIGTAEVRGEHVLAYNLEKMVQICIRDGMTREEALEYIDANVVNGFPKAGAPVVIYEPI